LTAPVRTHWIGLDSVS